MVIVHVLTMLRVEVDTDDEAEGIKEAERIVNEWRVPRPDISVAEVWEGRTNIHIYNPSSPL